MWCYYLNSLTFISPRGQMEDLGMSDWRVPLNMWHSGKNSSQITKVAGIKSQERNMLETGDLPPNMQMGCGGHGMFVWLSFPN